jgi:hypothetical protein
MFQSPYHLQEAYERRKGKKESSLATIACLKQNRGCLHSLCKATNTLYLLKAHRTIKTKGGPAMPLANHTMLTHQWKKSCTYWYSYSKILMARGKKRGLSNVNCDRILPLPKLPPLWSLCEMKQLERPSLLGWGRWSSYSSKCECHWLITWCKHVDEKIKGKGVIGHEFLLPWLLLCDYIHTYIHTYIHHVMYNESLYTLSLSYLLLLFLNHLPIGCST